jgi:hypothetical protein
MAVYEQWQRGRDQFIDQMEDVASRTNLPAEEANDLVSGDKRVEAVKQFRGIRVVPPTVLLSLIVQLQQKGVREQLCEGGHLA